MAIHLHQQISAGTRHKLLEHVEGSFGFGLQNLEGHHAALAVHLNLMLVSKRLKLRTSNLLAQYAAINVITALNRRFAAAHGLNHRAGKHDAVMRGSALRIGAEN